MLATTRNVSLKKYNTFGIDVIASEFLEIRNSEQLTLLFSYITSYEKFLILGGGSNILFTQDFDGLVIKNSIEDIKVIEENSEYVVVEVSAGTNWHKFISYLVNQNFSGLENLALIPGTVGAAPIQNIGAYGTEQMDCFVSLNGFNIEKNKIQTYSKDECKFSYRNSIFKNELKGKFVITSVCYKLQKTFNANTAYTELKNYIENNKLELTLQNIFHSVINIRNSKLPNYEIIGNAGSFFKNPIISKSLFESIKIEFPELNGFITDDGNIKVSAAWLIEKSGMKGYRNGNAGVYDKHALVLVNHGTASGKEIYDISENVINTVNQRFAITLEREVNVL